MHACVFLHMGLETRDLSMSAFFLHYFLSYFFETEPLTNLKLVEWLDWLASMLQESSCYHNPRILGISQCYQIFFFK